MSPAGSDSPWIRWVRLVAAVTSGTRALRAAGSGVPFLLPVQDEWQQDEHGDVGALPALRGLQEEQEGLMLCFEACYCLVATILGMTAWAKVPLGLVKL